MPSRRDVCINNARYAEEKGDWAWAAANYLEAGLPSEALNAVKKIEDRGGSVYNLVHVDCLRLMKHFGILQDVANYLITKLTTIADIGQLADNLMAVEEYVLAARAYRKQASKTEMARAYSFQIAASAFTKGGDKDAALNCLAEGYHDGKDIHLARLREIYEMGLLDEFIDRLLPDKALALKIMEEVAHGSPNPNNPTWFDAWRHHGGLDRFLERMLTIDPVATGRAVHRNTLARSDPNCLLRCYEAARRAGSLTAEDKGEISKWGSWLAEIQQRGGDLRKAGKLWSEAGEVDPDRLMRSAAYNRAAECFIDVGDYEQAAAMLEKAALSALPGGGKLVRDQTAKLYERAGNIPKAASIYEQSGRKIKAARIKGVPNYSLEEVKSMAPLYSELSVNDSRSFVQKLDLSSCPEAEAAYKRGDIEATVAAWKQDLMTRSHVYEHWYFIPEFYKRAGQMDRYKSALQEVEEYFRRKGEWILAAKMYFSDEQYDDFDRVCIEEDELEIAVLWYEQANMPERAAKIYDLMGQTGKSGKAQSEGAKQKPQDAAKPESDSAEESDRSDFDQLVCPRCGAEIKPHWTVCPKCDADLQQRKCRNCGEPLEQDWNRCPVCRTILKD